MGRLRRRAAAAAALGLVACAFIGIGGHGARAQADAGTRAIEYLQSQQSATDGSLAGGFSVNDLYVIGAAAGGYDPHLLKHGGPSAVDYLTAHAAAACPDSASASASAGNCGYLMQAALAAGADPRAFGGLDLVTRLTAYLDPATGKYGSGSAFDQAISVQALVAAGRTVPPAALTFLHAAEDSDGGWDYLDVHDDPNAAKNFDTSDSNSTAMVLMALDAAGDHSADSAGLAWLHTLQTSDGGFSFQGGASDPDSTALALQAILASGAKPTAPRWTVSGHTPATELVATQDPSGGYTFPGNPGPDTFTTSQVPPALFGQALPVRSYSQSFAPSMEHRAALNALEYLEGQQSASDGSLAGGFSVNDLYVIGAAAAGYDPHLLQHGGPSAVDYLTLHADSACPANTSPGASAGNCGYLIQGALAAAADPRGFGGIDLIARLGAYFDPATGKYGSGSAFDQALSIQALVAAGQTVPAAALTFLHTAEDSDGGWDYLDVHDDPNAAKNFDTSDSNSTAMVLMALDAAGDHSADSTGLGWMHTLQSSDGGFSFQGGASDPDSTALVLQAILASDASPTAPAWTTVSGHTPASELVATQDLSGGYTFPGNPGPDTFTTSQVPPALAGTPLPIPAAATLYAPGTALGATPPPPTPTPTPTATPPIAAGPVTPPASLVPSAMVEQAAQSSSRSNSAAADASRGSDRVAGQAGVSAPTAAAKPPAPTARPVPTAAPSPSQPPHSVAEAQPAAQGIPGALLYALVAIGAAIVVAGAGLVVVRR